MNTFVRIRTGASIGRERTYWKHFSLIATSSASRQRGLLDFAMLARQVLEPTIRNVPSDGRRFRTDLIEQRRRFSRRIIATGSRPRRAERAVRYGSAHSSSSLRFRFGGIAVAVSGRSRCRYRNDSAVTRAPTRCGPCSERNVAMVCRAVWSLKSAGAPALTSLAFKLPRFGSTTGEHGLAVTSRQTF